MDLKEFLEISRKKTKLGIAVPQTVEHYFLKMAEDEDTNISEVIQRVLISNVPSDQLLPPDVQQEIIDGVKNYLCRLNIKDVIFYVRKIKDMSSQDDMFWFLDVVLDLNSNSLFEKRNFVQILSYNQNLLESIKQKILKDEQVKQLISDSIEECKNIFKEV